MRDDYLGVDFISYFKNSLIISADDKFTAPQIVNWWQACDRNFEDKKCSVFFSVQGFKNQKRTLENLANINAWAIDLDSGTKDEQRELLEMAPIAPSFVLETRRGHHVYWLAKNATEANYRRIIDNLVGRFNADKNAKDLARILRLPNFYQWKDEKPFVVRIVYATKKVFSEEEMKFFFLGKEKKREPVNLANREGVGGFVSAKKSPQVFDKSATDFDKIDNKAVLLQISNTSYVNGDTIEFKQNSNGTEQIWVNGKSTACWIDKAGKIGSHDKGGPTVFQWLNWYYKDSKYTAEVLRGLNVLK